MVVNRLSEPLNTVYFKRMSAEFEHRFQPESEKKELGEEFKSVARLAANLARS